MAMQYIRIYTNVSIHIYMTCGGYNGCTTVTIPFLRRAQVEMGSFLIQGGFAPSLCGQTLLFNLLQPKSEALTNKVCNPDYGYLYMLKGCKLNKVMHAWHSLHCFLHINFVMKIYMSCISILIKHSHIVSYIFSLIATSIYGISY